MGEIMKSVQHVWAAGLAIIMGGCFWPPATQVPPRELVTVTDPVTGYLVTGEAVSIDGRDYVQIDDMLFASPKSAAADAQAALGHIGWTSMWPNGTFSYRLAEDVRRDPVKKARFESACRSITAGSGIRCLDIDAGGNPAFHPSHVVVSNAQGNYSYVGFQGGPQPIGIYNWNNEVIIAHEIKHALGWVHEHQRPDRDRVVEIKWGNILPGRSHNFEILRTAKMASPYQCSSIMHYPSHAFSRNGQPTIVPRPGYEDQCRSMGQTSRITTEDISEIIGVYGDPKTEWCGRSRKPDWTPPHPSCFLECYSNQESGYGEWQICGGPCENADNRCR